MKYLILNFLNFRKYWNSEIINSILEFLEFFYLGDDIFNFGILRIILNGR